MISTTNTNPYREFLLEKPKRLLSEANTKIRMYSRVVGQIGLFTLNTLFFTGQVTKKFPAEGRKITLLLLNCIGVVDFPYRIHLLIKTGKDVAHSYQSRNRTIMLLSTLRILQTVSTLGLVASDLTAAIYGIQGDDQRQAEIYAKMTYWGEATIGVSLFLMLGAIGVDAWILKKMKTEHPTTDLIQIVDELGINSTHISSPSYPASMVRFSMDKDTLNKLVTTLAENGLLEKEKLYAVIMQNIELQQKVNLGGNLFLTILNYALMAIERKATPNSLVSASINLGVSTVATSRVVVETFREIKQRRIIRIISESVNQETFI